MMRLLLCRHGQSEADLEPRLAERSSGLLAGLTRAEADARFPVTHPLPMYHRPPEGESYLDHYTIHLEGLT